MEKRTLLKLRLLEKDDAGGLSLFLKNHGTHHYQLDRLFYWGKVEDYVANLILEFSLNNSVWVAEDSGGVKGLIGFRKREWDTRHFGYPVASIDYFFVEKSIGGREAAFLLVTRFNKWIEENSIKFGSIKVFPDNNISQVLGENGFYYVGNEFILSKSLPDSSLEERLSENIRLFKPNDRDYLLKIIEDVSWLGRFHSDFHIDKRQADQLYISWLSNGIKKNNSALTVLEVNGKPSGFVLWSYEHLSKKSKDLMIGDQELVAIDRAVQGKGYGKALYRGALIQMQKAGIDLVKTCIAANNAPALNNQVGLGFGLNYNIVIFHRFF